ncbi:MAG TPA: iron-containing redox enzyme family protein [Myxococcota bacterium]|nr:iron-containing redox enzyme family protein [Myxococcota bacterium]
MRESWELITRGDPTEFVDALEREALDHPAVHHPFLEGIASGTLPDVESSLRDYAFQYACYSREFPSYLIAVIENLESERHRETLLENLAEERGDPSSDRLDRMPHTELFARFQRAIGVDDRYRAEHKPATTVEVWRDLALQKCRSDRVGVAIGAIGIGTEFVVPTIYTYLLEGIRKYTSLREDDYFFFTLHAQCDRDHAMDLRLISIDIAQEAENREALRFGVWSALNLRKAFFDIMLSRAMDAPAGGSLGD